MRWTVLALIGTTSLVLCACAGSPAPPTPSTSRDTPSIHLSPPAACAGPAAAAGDWSITSGGDVRHASVHVPPVATNGEPLPVVLVFHGYRDAPADVESMTAMSVKADEAGFIAVYPAALGEPARWDFDGTSDMTFVDDLLTKLQLDLCVDPTRIYATGMSLGGGMSNLVGCRLASRIAAIGPVSGVYGPNWGGGCVPDRPVPVIAFHGRLDPIVPYRGGPIEDPEHGEIEDLPPTVGVEQWAAGWATTDGCDPEPVEQPVLGEVTPHFWTGCIADVQLYAVLHGGHTWPGSPWQEPLTTRDVSATDLVWQFFLDHPRPPN